MDGYHLLTLITLLTVFLMLWTGARVAMGRAKYGIKAPATTGNPDFERIFRVQMNTLENVAMFLPSLWLFGLYVSGLWAAVAGVVWLFGRVWYVLGYSAEASKRGPGFGIGSLALVILAVGALIGVVMQLVQGGV